MHYSKPSVSHAVKLLKKENYLTVNKDGFSLISVSDICKKAAINRTTFYSNYEDIYALADAMRSEIEAGFILNSVMIINIKLYLMTAIWQESILMMNLLIIIVSFSAAVSIRLSRCGWMVAAKRLRSRWLESLRLNTKEDRSILE